MFGDRYVSHPTLSQHPAPLRRIRRALPAALFILALCACGKQGEGERCDVNNGSLDCEAGLICRILDTGSLCCPGDTSQPSVDACLSGNTDLPPDPEPPDAAASDQGGESPADGGGDSGT